MKLPLYEAIYSVTAPTKHLRSWPFRYGIAAIVVVSWRSGSGLSANQTSPAVSGKGRRAQQELRLLLRSSLGTGTVYIMEMFGGGAPPFLSLSRCSSYLRPVTAHPLNPFLYPAHVSVSRTFTSLPAFSESTLRSHHIIRTIYTQSLRASQRKAREQASGGS